MTEAVSFPTYTKLELDDLLAAQGPSGRLLDSAESAAYQSGVTSIVDLTGLAITFEVAARPVVVTLLCPYALASAAAVSVYQITDAAGVAKRLGAVYFTAANLPDNIIIEEEITEPGTYTRKAQFGRLSGAGLVANNYPGGAATVVSRLSAQEQ